MDAASSATCLFIHSEYHFKEKVNSAVPKLLSKSFNEVLGSGYIGRGRRREESRRRQPEKNGRGFHRERKVVVINFNIFTRV